MKHRSGTAEPAPSGALSPVWRDAWAWLVAGLVLPLFFVGRGIPLGEPALDDFDYLYDTFFRKHIDWLGGCGAPLYWRPVSRQLYYLLIAPFAVPHPGIVALLQAGLLALAGVLFYRALRPAWTAPMAAAAAAFPIALEAGVQLVTYTSCAEDLLALIFGAALLLALSRGRLGPALVWLALALLSKESSTMFAAAMPLWPALIDRDGRRAGPRTRIRVAFAAGAVIATWWLAHEWASHIAGLVAAPRIAGAGPFAKLTGAVQRIGLETLDAGDARSPVAPWIAATILVVTAVALGAAFASPAGRARLRAALPWFGWAAVWVGLATLPAAWYMPTWGSYRAVVPAVGLGIALVALLRSAGAWAVALVSALRFAALLAVPPVPDRIPLTFVGTNVDFDLVSLGSLQRLAHEVRVLITREHPTLPHGARVVRYQWPRMMSLAFAERKAFRVWYRDSTLQVVGMTDVQRAPLERLDLAVEFEPLRTPQVALIAPRALRVVLLAADSLRGGRAAAAECLLADFEREQPDTNAAVFVATGLALRGAALLAQDRVDEAGPALQSALHSNPDDPNAHRLLAEVYRRRRQLDLAEFELRRHLALMPDDAEASRQLEALLHPRP